MPDWEMTIKMWAKDEEEESIAQMCQDMADGMDQIMALEKSYQGVEDSNTCGILNVTYQEAFYPKEGNDGKNSIE